MIKIKRNKGKELSCWHMWYAWRPVVVGETPDGDSIHACFENVLRCGVEEYSMGGNYWRFKYKRKDA